MSIHDLRFLLLQVRDADDPMRRQEVESFERCFGLAPGRITVFDLLGGAPSARVLGRADVVLLGGSGDYSVARGGSWLPAALEAMVGLYETSTPTFASCWGFQAMARALGGEVVNDRSRAEVGVTWMELTDAGRDDPVFGPLGPRFQVVAGHEDHVTALPEGAVRLATTPRSENQAFHFPGRPIYCTQFHPELDRRGLIDRLREYPAYLPLTGASSFEELERITPELPDTQGVLRRFLEQAMAHR